MKMKTRREHAKELGRRVSRGEWERYSRLYEVHHAKNFDGQPKFRLAGYEVNEDGTRKLDKDGKFIPTFLPCLVHTLARETVKCNRKVSMTDRYVEEKSKRRQYLGQPLGYTR